eukprot:CAMPEP_0172535140 /NCGR_PEP_ID=MMETSP1067-20121228/7276_1 /TAXON_ID=265564 ORGANISM="Thalassiosira punctigera, Strain Tpunct2005C2" /NCGR_SAMPLE_ID=MMETSP1067 /ASSEMBLY_ACC=CAM_ASM_000444 /LENGTH=279 /DNA_ID=CAMNT_0013320043 /DNA_START=100 /DNA_END=939 /DNA_ORIENTATION=-
MTMPDLAFNRGRRPLVRWAVLFLILILQHVSAWTNIDPKRKIVAESNRHIERSTMIRFKLPRPSRGTIFSAVPSEQSAMSRRDGIKHLILSTTLAAALLHTQSIQPASAYTPDPDPLRESLYFVSRVQEATVQQERFVRRASRQELLKSKMKLTLRLVEKNYRLLDQITYVSQFITPESKVVEATNAGYEAAEALQNAIDYVKEELGTGEFDKGQKEYLIENLAECREKLFDFLAYVPQEKLEGARRRVEEENVANRDEFDGDSDAGVYNPVVLPWKDR